MALESTLTDTRDRRTPSVRELVTVVVTTSPVISHPSLSLLETTLGSFRHAPDLWGCRKVIVCDGCRYVEEDSDQRTDTAVAESSAVYAGEERIGEYTQGPVGRYSSAAKAMRSGFVDARGLSNYVKFKQSLVARVHAEAKEQWHPENAPFADTSVLELDSRHGYANALREVLLSGMVTTDYVCVVQHDRSFLRPVPIGSIVEAMRATAADVRVSPDGREGACDAIVKSVGLMTRSNANHLGRVIGRPGLHGLQQDMESLILVPPELQEEGQTHEKKLIPLFQFYDSTHVALTSFYTQLVFAPSSRVVGSGGFVEEHVSAALQRALKDHGIRKGHSIFGCYLFDDGMAWEDRHLASSSPRAPSVPIPSQSGDLRRRAHRSSLGHVGHLNGATFGSVFRKTGTQREANIDSPD